MYNKKLFNKIFESKKSENEKHAVAALLSEWDCYLG